MSLIQDSYFSNSGRNFHKNFIENNNNLIDLYNYEEVEKNFNDIKKIYEKSLPSIQSNLHSKLDSLELSTPTLMDELIQIEPAELDIPLDQYHPLLSLINNTDGGLFTAMEYFIGINTSWERLFLFLNSDFSYDRRNEVIQNPQFFSLLLEKFEENQAYAIILSLLHIESIDKPINKQMQALLFASFLAHDELVPIDVIISKEFTFLHIACLVNPEIKLRTTEYLKSLQNDTTEKNIVNFFKLGDLLQNEEVSNYTGLLILDHLTENPYPVFILSVRNTRYLFIPISDVTLLDGSSKSGLFTLEGNDIIQKFLNKHSNAVAKAKFID